jgi:Mg2+ and Co2+ transporter CorA
MAKCLAVFFDDSGMTEVEGVEEAVPSESELLWIEISERGALDEARRVGKGFGLPADLVPGLSMGSHPAFCRRGPWVALRVAFASVLPQMQLEGRVLWLLAGENLVMTIHEQAIEELAELQEGMRQSQSAGSLTAGSFLAAVLDLQLASYFKATSTFELEIDRLENAILERRDPKEGYVAALQRLRRSASRLRRMLAPHRTVFASLSRPDFAPDAGTLEARHYRSLGDRFESAMDVVENARELVIGSFQLFSSQTDLQTNQVMRLLTFTTVVTGVFAVIAGVLGMNFEEAFFKSPSGFWVALAGMALVAVGAYVLGKRGKWF